VRILWELGSSRLKAAGYDVEKVGSELYARRSPSTFPDRLRIEAGKVSERTVNSLIKKAK